MTSKTIIYLSFDVETDGPSPLVNNLLSIGIYGLDMNLNNLFTFEANIVPLENHIQDKTCMETFWLKPENKNAFDYLHTNSRNYINVFAELSDKLNILSDKYKIIFIAQPACFDWMFLKCYYELAKKNSNIIFYDIGFQCKCISTALDHYMIKNKIENKNKSKTYNEILNHSENSMEHHALYDAKIQGIFYVNLLKMIE